MSSSLEERRLRELFQELREQTESGSEIPVFDAMIERAKVDPAGKPTLEGIDVGGDGRAAVRARRRYAWGGWASAAVAAGILAIVMTRGGGEDEAFERLVTAYATDVTSGAWSSPTAGLLEVPGLELLRGVPTLGGSVTGQPGERPEDPSAEDGGDRP